MNGSVKSFHLIPKGKAVTISKLDSKGKTTPKAKSGTNETRDDEKFLELAELVDNSRVLFKATSVFPFAFFPDSIIVDKDKVSIITRVFFSSDRRQSILVKNIADCFVDTDMMFGNIRITDKFFADSSESLLSIKYLRKKDAVRARDIIQGLIVCHDKKVDIAEMKRNELLPYLEEIGRATE